MAALGLSLGLWLACGAAWAQKSNIYTCDVNGRRVTSDRPIPECLAREQKRLNTDGSVAEVVRPSMTADERAEFEQKERDAKAERDRVNDAIRRDRNLVQRYPNEAAHNKARAKAMEELEGALNNSRQRISMLQAERKPLEEEKKFYMDCPEKKPRCDDKERVQGPIPIKLKIQLDANDAGLEAQNTLNQNLSSERVRVNKIYDEELKRLRALWSGTPPGSLPPTTAAAEPPKSTTR